MLPGARQNPGRSRSEVSDSQSLRPLSQAARSREAPVQLREGWREVSAREGPDRRTRGPEGGEGSGGDSQAAPQPGAPGALATGCAREWQPLSLRWLRRGRPGIPAPRRRRGAAGRGQGGAAVPAAAGWGSCARPSLRPRAGTQQLGRRASSSAQLGGVRPSVPAAGWGSERVRAPGRGGPPREA